jgi:enamine deaminase RidA (YjgF/YER057c/UK114 family)
MKREPMNPWDWGLQFQMDQAEVVTHLSKTLHFSGQTALKSDPDLDLGISVVAPGDIRAQTQYALECIDEVLEKAGMSRKELRFFTTDVDAFLENCDVYASWISEAGIRPPQSLLGVNRLVFPDLKIEIEATAGV